MVWKRPSSGNIMSWQCKVWSDKGLCSLQMNLQKTLNSFQTSYLHFPTTPAQNEAPPCSGYTMEAPLMLFSNIEDAVIMLCADALKINNTSEKTGNHIKEQDMEN